MKKLNTPFCSQALGSGHCLGPVTISSTLEAQLRAKRWSFSKTPIFQREAGERASGRLLRGQITVTSSILTGLA